MHFQFWLQMSYQKMHLFDLLIHILTNKNCFYSASFFHEHCSLLSSLPSKNFGSEIGLKEIIVFFFHQYMPIFMPALSICMFSILRRRIDFLTAKKKSRFCFKFFHDTQIIFLLFHNTAGISKYKELIRLFFKLHICFVPLYN